MLNRIMHRQSSLNLAYVIHRRFCGVRECATWADQCQPPKGLDADEAIAWENADEGKKQIQLLAISIWISITIKLNLNPSSLMARSDCVAVPPSARCSQHSPESSGRRRTCPYRPQRESTSQSTCPCHGTPICEQERATGTQNGNKTQNKYRVT